MMRFDPFREIEELQQRVDRAFGGNARAGTQNFFAPNVDVHENEQGLEIDLDLPGVDPQNIRVEAENNTLTVQAERRYENQAGRTAHRTERAYGTFVRTFNIPSRYDLSKIEAKEQHGTLTLRVPRAEQALRRSIPVKSGVSNAPQTLEAGNASQDGGSQNNGSQDTNAQNANQGDTQQ